MRKKLVMLLLVLLALVIATPASAVKWGQPDNGEHPHVGLIVFYQDAGATQPAWRCTGTMISARVMLTAGHCTELNSRAQVYFQEDVTTVAGYPLTGGVLGTAYTYPGWQGGLFLPNTGDVGVVVLDAAPGLGTSPLAPVGYLDGLATARGNKPVDFKVVGYGLQSVKPVESAVRVRLKAWVQLVNLNSQLTDGYNVHTTNNPGQGTGGGGTCFGDSGGSIFNVDNQIVAVNSFVLNANCAGASFGYRLDRQEVQDWIYGHVNANP